MDLPVELIFLILDNVRTLPGGIKTLQACSLVSRQLRIHSQELIFSILDLRFGVTQADRRQLLYDAVEANPNLRTYIRELRLEVFTTMISHWNRTLAIIPPKLESLMVTGGTGFIWPRCTEEVQSALANLLTLPTLATLHIDHLSKLPGDLIRSFVQIKHLMLTQTTHDSLLLYSEGQSETPVQLVSLDINHVSAPLIAYLTSSLKRNPTSLATLNIQNVDDYLTLAEVWKLVRTAGKGIKHLKWTSNPLFPLSRDPPDFGSLPLTLRRITFIFNCLRPGDKLPRLPDLYTFLERLSSTGVEPVLDTLVIRPYCRSRSFNTVSSLPIEVIRELNLLGQRLLEDRAMLPALREVWVEWELPYLPDDRVEQDSFLGLLCTASFDALAGLRERGIDVIIKEA